ncbi:PQQ-dependent sugar dehydrogenase [soil metagenome]
MRAVAALAMVALLLAACRGEQEQGAGEGMGNIPLRTREPATEFATEPAPTTPPPTRPSGPTSPSPTGAPPSTPTSAATQAPGDVEEAELEATVVASGLEAPWEVVFTAEGRVLLTERDTGVVSEVADDGAVTELQTLPVESQGEGGLLGLAVAPATEDAGHQPLLYAYLSTSEDNRIVRFVPGDEPEPVLTGIPRARIHNGGRLAFGPDGMLYVGTGDAGASESAQDPESLAGKVLRLTPEGEVPDDNPTPSSPVWSLGHRNVQGLAFDADGALFASEFGPDRDDEINRIEPGANYGWPVVTGEAGEDGFVDPIFVRQPADASWSGLAVLTDGAIPQWEGDLFVAALRGERLWRLALDAAGAVVESEELFVGELGRIRQVVQAPDGALWLLTNNRDARGDPAQDDDRIIRIAPVGL